jgi:hypothetical protein
VEGCGTLAGFELETALFLAGRIRQNAGATLEFVWPVKLLEGGRKAIERGYRLRAIGRTLMV